MDQKPVLKKRKTAVELKCEVCGKVYKIKKYFQNHVQSHTPTNPNEGAVTSKNYEPTNAEGESELPPDYTWENWCDDVGTEEPTYFELEDEEEESRRDEAAGINTAGATGAAKKKKEALVKCPDCHSSFVSLDGYIRHRACHGMKAAFMNAPSLERICDVCPDLCLPILESFESSQLKGGHAPIIASMACRLKEELNSPAMQIFCNSVCEGLCTEFLKVKDFLSPSQLAITFHQKAAAYISSDIDRTFLHDVLCAVINSELIISDSNVFMAYFLRKLSNKILVFILRALRLGDGKAAVASLHDRYARSSQSTETTDFFQNMHYIGGSNVKSVFRTALKYKTAEWNRVVLTLRKFFLVSEFSSAPLHELTAWTELRDRGGLSKISQKALDFFVILGKEVQPLERLDGSLLIEEVFDAIGQCAPLLCLWDELKGELSDSESCKLLHALVSHFCYTWRNGIIGRRQDQMALTKSVKHGTGGVAFRARLGATTRK